MSGEGIGLPDLAAFRDVLGDINTEVSEPSTPARLVELYDALRTVSAALVDTLGLVHSALLKAAAEPARVGDEIVYANRAGKWRPNQTAVELLARERAKHDKNGERIEDVDVAVHEAVKVCAAMWRSALTMPKQGALDAMGVDKRDVASWQFTHYELQRSPVKAVPDE